MYFNPVHIIDMYVHEAWYYRLLHYLTSYRLLINALFFMRLWFMQSLCNACGIRQRKARRAMAAAAAAVAASGGAVVAASDVGVAAGSAVSSAQASDASQAGKTTKKEKRTADIDRSLPFKKRCKMVDHPTIAATKAVVTIDDALKNNHDRALAEDVAETERLSMASPSAAINHGFARDEITDAAMLLMNLSCGLIRG
jgi:uncharacterized cupredoxin-like copper-binding protein